MSKFRVYDPTIKKHVQIVNVSYGLGIEYLLLGEILERDYGFSFFFTPQEIQEDKGYALCSEIEQVLNRMPDYYTSKDKKVLKAIQKMSKEQQIAVRLAKQEDE